MSIEERKLSVINMTPALNPNAIEFVPSCFRSVSDASNRSDTSEDKPESTVPSNSDEEAHRYWQEQLPDDITPDFNVLGQDETPAHDSLSLAGLSMNDGFASSIFAPNQTSRMQHHASPFVRDTLSARSKIEFPGPEQTQATIMSPTASTMSPTAAPGVKTVRNGGQYVTNRRDSSHYNGDSSIGSPLQSDAYYRNRHSFRSTIDIMTQLENKVDGRLNQNLRSLSFGHSGPPSPVSYAQNGLANYNKEAFGLPNSPYRSHSAMFTDDIISPPAGRELISLDSPRGRYKTTNLPVPGLGSGRGSQLLGGSYNANMLEKDEVYDFASLRHALLEQIPNARVARPHPGAESPDRPLWSPCNRGYARPELRTQQPQEDCALHRPPAPGNHNINRPSPHEAERCCRAVSPGARPSVYTGTAGPIPRPAAVN